MSDLRKMTLESLALRVASGNLSGWDVSEAVSELRRRDEAVKRLTAVCQKVAAIPFTGEVADQLRTALAALEAQ